MSIWDVIVRSFIFIVVLFITTKFLGKKHISQLSLFEYITGITLGDIAGEMILGLDSSIMHGIAGIIVFASVSFLADFFSLKSRRFREFVEGKCTVFIEDGKILEDHLKKERYSLEDLSALLRQKDVFNISDVEFAVLESKGNLSVLLKKESQPVTPKDLKMTVAHEKEPQTIIIDGEILYDALGKTGKTLQWLNMELDKLGVTVDNVFMAQIDTYGELTIDIYDDKLKVSASQARPQLLATIKKCQTDLEGFVLQTNNQNAKEMYKRNAEKLKEIEGKLTPFLYG